MPLCLKSLELHGYKTFAARTVFEFAGPITAIVGPNGGGKSNIADALRWVLGEQSYSLLRAKRTEDMIFSGSEQRPRAGMASATVLFDNADDWLPVDFAEVALSRRAYRDGRNEYLLNGQHVRLREINELLSQSGLSERTYTVIGQGLVDASLSLKADERRRLFEEAAGIGLYRARREEALRRLDTTQRNLDRVLDILAELDPRLRSLEKQAKRAQEFAQVQADLRVLLLEWYGYLWHRAQKDLAEIREVAHQREEELQGASQTYQAVRQQFTAFREHLTGLRARLNAWHRQSAELHSARATISRDLAVLEERRRALLDNRQSTLSEHGRLAEEVRMARERLTENEQEATHLKSELDEAQSQAEAARESLQTRQTERGKVEQALSEARRSLSDLNARRAELQARIDEAQRRAGSQHQKLDEATQAIAAAEQEVRQAEENHRRALKDRQQAETDFQQAEAAWQDAQTRLSALEESRKKRQAERAGKEAEQARLEAQLDVLEQAEQSLTGFADGARFLLEAARQARLKGTRGALSAALDVPDELELAIAAALGEYLDAILLEKGRDVEPALTLLDSDQSGRASLLPLEWLASSAPLAVPRGGDCLGVAADLVQAPPELRPAVNLLLGQVLVVLDRAAARRVLAGQPAPVRAVTLRGEVFNASGPVLAGRQARSGTLSRPRQRREFQESLAGVARQVAELDGALRKIDAEMDAARDDLAARTESLRQARVRAESASAVEQQAQVQVEAARRQRDWRTAQRDSLQAEIAEAEKDCQQSAAVLSQAEEKMLQVQEEFHGCHMTLEVLTLDELQSQVTYWDTRAAVSERALSDAYARQAERRQALARLEEQQTALQTRLDEIDRLLAQHETDKEALRQQEGALHQQLEALRLQIAPAEKELESAEQQEAGLQEKEIAAQQMLAKAERQYTQAQLDSTRRQEALGTLRHKVEDDFGLVAFEYAANVPGPVPLPMDGMVEQLPLVTDLPADLEDNLTRQRALLRRMGAINPEAQQEYQSVRERFEFLNTQLDDLRKAEADLRQVIRELDDLTRRDFNNTFAKVAEEFHVIFHRLFGGGSAKLVLTDPEHLTETGIDIEARLPGRREQGLALLSGGERSLTAIALIFALLKVSPTPICVLDEVDAMLDDANVVRFRELLEELSKDTQFVIITHNRGTVQAADVIYGVTMGRDSTSQVISLKLDEISEDYLQN